MTKTVATYPAYDIIEAPVHVLSGYPVLTSGDTLALKDNNHRGTFTIGSVASFAIERNNCPFEARERAESFGHNLYYIFSNASSISNMKRAKKIHVEVHYGMEVLFEGIVFTIEKDWNNNLKLVRVGTLKEAFEKKIAEQTEAQ